MDLGIQKNGANASIDVQIIAEPIRMPIDSKLHRGRCNPYVTEADALVRNRKNEYGRVGMHVVRALLAVAIMAAPGIVVGASFDCSKAGTSVEKTICASRRLSDLDEQLANAYESVILLSDHPDRVRSLQWEWLRNARNQCRDEACLKGVYENRLAQLAATKKLQWKSFHNTHLGIEFSYPSNRKVKIGCRGSKNCIALLGKPMPNSDYLVAFEVFDGDLETVAVDKAVFEKKHDGWIARGSSGEHPVAQIAGPGWQGLKSTVDCGVSDSNGFHANAGECMWVVLSNGKRSVVVDTQGIVGIDEVSMRSIHSIRFSK
jgi:uncharacterized protein